MPRTVDIAAHAISIHQQEIAHLMSQEPVDHLAVEELLVKCQRLNGQILSAQHITDAAARPQHRAAVATLFDRFFPNAQTILTPGAFRATR